MVEAHLPYVVYQLLHIHGFLVYHCWQQWYMKSARKCLAREFLQNSYQHVL